MDVFFTSFFGVGFLPKAPGTMASLLTLPFLYALGQSSFPPFFLIPILLLCVIPSCFIMNSIEKKYHVKDPSWIVIDEVLGMGVAWFFIPSPHLGHLVAIFFLFRFFDILKIWPASFFDRHMKHGAGIILDDLVSALQAGILYRLLWQGYLEIRHALGS